MNLAGEADNKYPWSIFNNAAAPLKGVPFHNYKSLLTEINYYLKILTHCKLYFFLLEVRGY